MPKEVTELQAAMIKKIARDEMTCLNGGEPSNVAETETWANGVIETPQDKGVFTSLLNAGLVWHQKEIDHGQDASFLGLTEAGFTVYKSL
jgi:hypothetical protein